jgi:crossover junction endodeoxyribonuclease RuvC
MINILGIDVGTAIVGWSIIQHDSQFKNGMNVVDYGVIRTSSSSLMPRRLEQIWEELREIAEKYKPQHMAVESLFYFKNQTTVMSVSQARGVILLAGQQYGLEIFEYTPLQVKMGVTGYGRAEKGQVQKMVQMILGLKEIPKPDDAADALAIAINHASTLSNAQKGITKR